MYRFEDLRDLDEPLCKASLSGNKFLDEILNSEDASHIDVRAFKNPHDFYFFNKKVLFNFEVLMTRVEHELSELNISRSEVEEYINNGYFPELVFDDGEKGFMSFTTMRIKFIKEIRQKWNYNSEEIRQITKYEDMLIDEVLTTDEFEYCDLPNIPFLIKYLKDNIRVTKILLKSGKELEQEYKNEIEKDSETLKLLEGKEWEDLSWDSQKSINDYVYKINGCLEFFRLRFHSEYEAKILMGFSQQPTISASRSTFLDSKKTNKTPNKEALYSIDYNQWTWEFSRWAHSPKNINPEDVFFATPEFYIGNGKDDKIPILVRNRVSVNSRFFRNIEKYYTKFRNRQRIPKTKWGEKSGKKELVRIRNSILRDEYSKIRLQDPRQDASESLEKAVEAAKVRYEKETGEKMEALSTDRLKVIIYTKKP
jgi:hypothetical protein